MDQATNQRIKIVLYCHIHYGLGHIVRTVRIAEALLASGKFVPSILTGGCCFDSIAISAGISVEKLPPYPEKMEERESVMSFRANRILNYIIDKAPDIVLIDALPFGFKNELLETFIHYSSKQKLPKFIYGAPYSPQESGAIGDAFNYKELLALYSSGMVYLDEIKPGFEVDLPFPLHPVGMIAGARPPKAKLDSRNILVFSGGGMVSREMLKPMIRSTSALRDENYKVLFIAGPLSDFEDLKRLTKHIHNFNVEKECPIEKALGDAKIVVSRCGYNTASALVRSTIPIVFVPYHNGRAKEQLLRAKELGKLKNISVMEFLNRKNHTPLKKAINEALSQIPEERIQQSAYSGTEGVLNFLLEMTKRKEDVSLKKFVFINEH